MAATKKLSSVSDIRLKVNMREILGRALPDDEQIREAIAQKAVDLIIERTQSGKDLAGKPFKPYSKAYKSSDAFKGFGKGSTPNLTLSGDMLGLMDIVSSTRNTFDIGWTDDTENAKAYNHDTGDTVPKREFLGLRAQEVKELRAFAEKLLEKNGEG